MSVISKVARACLCGSPTRGSVTTSGASWSLASSWPTNPFRTGAGVWMVVPSMEPSSAMGARRKVPEVITDP